MFILQYAHPPRELVSHTKPEDHLPHDRELRCRIAHINMFVSQETFDDVVKENIEDFGMDREAAAKDAAEQFKSQGETRDQTDFVYHTSSSALPQLYRRRHGREFPKLKDERYRVCRKSALLAVWFTASFALACDSHRSRLAADSATFERYTGRVAC